MARPSPWLRRLPEILRAVDGATRTHYDRPAIEKLFQIQPSTAGKLMAVLPRSEALGRSHLVERNVLLRFLQELGEAGDTGSALSSKRKEPAKISRRKPRTLVRKDLVTDGQLIALPSNVKLERGRLVIDFRTVEELCENMAMVAGSIANDEEVFVAEYEPEQPPSESQLQAAKDRVEIQKLFAGLRAMQERDGKQAPQRLPIKATIFEGHEITRD